MPDLTPLRGRVRSLLSRSWFPWATVALALVLVSPCLVAGLVADDCIHVLRLSPGVGMAGFDEAPLDLFTFASGEEAQRRSLMEEGLFAWWTAEDFQLAFWRPLSSATHVLDHVLWPGSALLKHAHSMAWFGALLAVVALVYRRFHGAWVASLALLLYAVDDARGFVLSFVANRNALIAAMLGLGALVAHDRWRRSGWAAGGWLAPLLLGLGLLAGESALAVTGYLFAHAVFLDTGSVGRRLSRLWPYAVISVVWMTAYRLLGYGTRGSGIYVSPLDEPGRFLGALVERMPVLLLAQAGGFVSDLWLVIPPGAQLVVQGLAFALLVAAGWLLRPLWGRDPVARFWTLGLFLATVPVTATFPMDRLLVLTGVGAMGLVAQLLSSALESGDAAGPARRRVLQTSAIVLVVVHLVVAPLVLPLRALSVRFLNAWSARATEAFPEGEAIRGKTLVVLRAPADGSVGYTLVERAARGVPRPAGLRLLASGLASVQVTRLDERTLRVRPALGFGSTEGERMVRGLSRPFRVGDEVRLGNLQVLVTGVNAEGRATEAVFRFDRPLEDPSLLWFSWQGAGLVPYSPPAVAAAHTLGEIDLGGAVRRP
jgi:hypothetical protein